MVKQIIVILIFFLFLSCNKKTDYNYSLKGNWYYFVNDTIYHERYFSDTNYINYCNIYRFSENYYKIRNDSLISFGYGNLNKELKNHYKNPAIKIIDSTKIQLIYPNEIYTLNKFSDTSITLNKLVNNFNDTNYFFYQLNYYKRGNNLIKKNNSGDTMEYIFNLSNNKNWNIVEDYFKQVD